MRVGHRVKVEAAKGMLAVAWRMDTDLEREAITKVADGPEDHDSEEFRNHLLSVLRVLPMCEVALWLAALFTVVGVELDPKPDILDPPRRITPEFAQLVEVPLGDGQLAKKPGLEEGAPVRANEGISGQTPLRATKVDVPSPTDCGILGDVLKNMMP